MSLRGERLGSVAGEEFAEFLYGASTMREGVFDIDAEFSESEACVLGREDGVVAETVGAAALGSNESLDLALKEVGLFDERFFMYPEDIDLTRRLHQRYQTLFYPEVSITHNHQKASYHSMRMLWIHCINMIRYFNKWGWIWDKERERINERVLQESNVIDVKG